MQRLLAFALILSSVSSLAKDAPKGTLPELRLNGGNEDENQKKALDTEILISKTENQAINTLIQILKKKRGRPEEAGYWYRLAELYMRRAKTGRFFDLHRDNQKAVSFAPREIREESAANNLRKATKIYFQIEKNFPRYEEMDAVLFSNAFAHEQLGLRKVAENLYEKIITKFSQSHLVPDARLALGEINYDAGKFNVALNHFLEIEKFPASRVYSYGMYKGAWTLYNLRKSNEAIAKMTDVVKYHDPRVTSERKLNHNLRSEALRDISIFFADIHPPEKAFAFFDALCTPDELGEAIISLGKLYESHSRHKEMLVFLNDYISKVPTGPQVLKAHLLLVDALESLKKRHDVVSELKRASATCLIESKWRLANQKSSGELCDVDFPKSNLEIARKWWDLWLKNRHHKEIAELTRNAFEVYLERDDPKKPDTKSRFAYAELLFQLNDYRKASPQYELVGNFTTDSQNKHDSDYAALVSFQKASEQKKESKDDDELLRLSLRYLKHHPKGPNAEPVEFKVGFIHYSGKRFEEADKWLRALATKTKVTELKTKSEDLILDILNNKKDFAGIKQFAKQIIPKTSEDKRRQSLVKIMQEADFAAIEEYSRKASKSEAAEKLYGFFIEHKGSPLAKEALWQSLSLSYSAGSLIEGADRSIEYYKTFPKEKRSVDALKDAVKAYTDTGLFNKATVTMDMLLPHVEEADALVLLEAQAELYLIDHRNKEAKTAFSKLLEKKPKEQGRLLGKILATLKGKEDSAEYAKLESKILAMGAEPFASEIQLRKLKRIFGDKKMTEAFNFAKQIVGSKGPEAARAEARLIQAQILEFELVNQGLKSSVDRLAMVLAIKTDKLEKAQTAFLSALKMSSDPNLQLQALDGLSRCYKNFVDTVGKLQIKGELSDEERKALDTELANLTRPIAEKNQDLAKQRIELARKYKATAETGVDYANLPLDESIKAQAPRLAVELMGLALPSLNSDLKLTEVERLPASSKSKCQLAEPGESSKSLVRKWTQCLSSKNYSNADKLAESFIRAHPQSPFGSYFLSLSAYQQGLYEKALQLSELSLKKDSDIAIFHYQKGLSLLQLDKRAQAQASLLHAFDLKLDNEETRIVKAHVSYAQGDCLSAIEDLDKLSNKTRSQFGLNAVYGECLSISGKPDQAIESLQESLKKNKNDLASQLQLARVHELFKLNGLEAAKHYEATLKMTGNAEQKQWLQQKIAFLRERRTP